jgi:hypothetical protein
VRYLPLLLALACSGGKPRTPTTDDARRPPPPAPHDGAPQPPAGAGDLQIRVEWKDVPLAARSSPGRTPCDTPRAPQVQPTTTWGVPGAAVLVDSVTMKDPGEARVTLASCALAPRVSAGSSLVLASAMDRPARVTVTKLGDVAHLDALRPGGARTVQLPIAGHAVAIPVEAGGVYQLATDAAASELAWFIAGSAFVTEASGEVTVPGAAAGPHVVRAWLPAAGKLGKGSVTAVAGDLTPLTIDLAAP